MTRAEAKAIETIGNLYDRYTRMIREARKAGATKADVADMQARREQIGDDLVKAQDDLCAKYGLTTAAFGVEFSKALYQNEQA